LGVGATARPQQPTGPMRPLGIDGPKAHFCPTSPGAVIHGHSFCQPNHESSNPQQLSSCARSSSHRPLPVPSSLVAPPKHRFKPISRRSADAPPSAHPPTPPCPGWTTPQRQLNIHTRTRWPITDSISDATIVARPRPSAPYSSPATPSAATSRWFLLGSHGGPIAIAEPGGENPWCCRSRTGSVTRGLSWKRRQRASRARRCVPFRVCL
jgi:hypothetical protein